ncbi:hypothetical protein HDV00_006116 [Rhizophlyctis rosea]|nr:hypothetical protein HDV00_006116 [Rhizophlyctis rosea]
MLLLPEILRSVARVSDPITARNLRACNKILTKFISMKDLIWAEAVWRCQKEETLTGCWLWAMLNNHTNVVRCLTVQWGGYAYDVVLLVGANKGHPELVTMAIEAGSGFRKAEEFAKFWLLDRVAPELAKLASRMTDQARDGLAIYTLCAAVKHGHNDIVRILLAAGADARTDHCAALRVAAANGQTATAKIILEEGKLNQYLGSVEVTQSLEACVWTAAKAGHEEVVKLLLDAWCPSDPVIWRVYFQMAGASGHLGVVQVLLTTGASDIAKREALREASRAGHTEVVKALLAAGAKGRNEALRRAPWRGDVRRVLRDAGARWF